MVHLKSQGTPRQDSVVFSGLRRHVICSREKKQNFGILPRPVFWNIGGSFWFFQVFVIIRQSVCLVVPQSVNHSLTTTTTVSHSSITHQSDHHQHHIFYLQWVRIFNQILILFLELGNLHITISNGADQFARIFKIWISIFTTLLSYEYLYIYVMSLLWPYIVQNLKWAMTCI